MFGITWGPDGALWFTGGTTPNGNGPSGGFIGRMTTTGTVTTYALPAAGSAPNSADDIIAGPDGALWFDIPELEAIGHITTSGTIGELVLDHPCVARGFNAEDQILAGGPDGNVWAASDWTNGVVKMNAAGGLSRYAVQGTPHGITAGPDGHMWFVTTDVDGYVGQMSTDGKVTEQYPVPPAVSGNNIPPGAITTGPDGKLWIGRQAEIDVLDPSVAPPLPPISDQGGPPVPPTGAASGGIAPALGAGGIIVGAVLTLIARRRRRGEGESQTP